MIKASVPKGSRVDLARERLEQAVAEAEAATERLAARTADQSLPDGDAGPSAELAAAKAENEALREENREISERLDQVILKLKTMLGS